MKSMNPVLVAVVILLTAPLTSAQSLNRSENPKPQFRFQPGLISPFALNRAPLSGDPIMKKILHSMFGIVLTANLMFAAPQKKRVAILNFDFGAVQNWWGGHWDVGKGIADLIVDQLVKDGTYSVVERKQLDAIIAEQNFSNSDRADASTAAKIGKVLGLNVIIVGSVTQFGTEKKGFSVGGLAGGFGGLGAGKVGTQKGKAYVGVTARAIDVNTAEILASVTARENPSEAACYYSRWAWGQRRWSWWWRGQHGKQRISRYHPGRGHLQGRRTGGARLSQRQHQDSSNHH